MNLKLPDEPKPNIQISLKDKTGKTDPPPRYHFVYRAALPVSGEVWAIDPTGAQFGYRDVFYPWDKLERCGWKFVAANPVGGSLYTMAHMGAIEKREFCDALSESIPTLVKKYSGGCGGKQANLDGMLKGPDAAFEEVAKKFLGDVEDIIKRYMVKFSSPEETRKRHDMMRALVLDPTDPEVMKEIEEMVKNMKFKN